MEVSTDFCAFSPAHQRLSVESAAVFSPFLDLICIKIYKLKHSR